MTWIASDRNTIVLHVQIFLLNVNWMFKLAVHVIIFLERSQKWINYTHHLHNHTNAD